MVVEWALFVVGLLLISTQLPAILDRHVLTPLLFLYIAVLGVVLLIVAELGQEVCTRLQVVNEVIHPIHSLHLVVTQLLGLLIRYLHAKVVGHQLVVVVVILSLIGTLVDWHVARERVSILLLLVLVALRRTDLEVVQDWIAYRDVVLLFAGTMA